MICLRVCHIKKVKKKTKFCMFALQKLPDALCKHFNFKFKWNAWSRIMRHFELNQMFQVFLKRFFWMFFFLSPLVQQSIDDLVDEIFRKKYLTKMKGFKHLMKLCLVSTNHSAQDYLSGSCKLYFLGFRQKFGWESVKIVLTAIWETQPRSSLVINSSSILSEWHQVFC